LVVVDADQIGDDDDDQIVGGVGDDIDDELLITLTLMLRVSC